MTPIPLQHATKEEIIEAIQSEYAIGDVRKRLESAIYHIRCKRLLAEMDAAIIGMEENKQGETWDPKKWTNRQRFNRKFTKANNQLSKLQGT